MHTVIPAHCLIDGKTMTAYKVVHAERLAHPIAEFQSVDDASHFCNRLNGGCTGELAAFVKMLKPFADHAIVRGGIHVG